MVFDIRLLEIMIGKPTAAGTRMDPFLARKAA
jgi:hypothetical protein